MGCESTDDLESRIYALSLLAKAYKGELAGRIIEYVARKGEATDSEIAKALKVSEGEVRRIIWVLSTEGLLHSRKTVSETGWMTFYWTVPLDQVDGIILKLYRRIIDRLEKRLEYESQNIFYWCGNPEHPRYTFSEAAEKLFKCEICGKTLMPYDNAELVAALSWVTSEMKKIMLKYTEIMKEKAKEEMKEVRRG